MKTVITTLTDSEWPADHPLRDAGLEKKTRTGKVVALSTPAGTF